jgi:hypothetical protein
MVAAMGDDADRDEIDGFDSRQAYQPSRLGRLSRYKLAHKTFFRAHNAIIARNSLIILAVWSYNFCFRY